MQKSIISKNDDGIRLDKYLFKIMSAPAGEIYKSLRKKKIKINGNRTTNGKTLLSAGDVVELYINDEFLNLYSMPSQITSPPLQELNIVYEDDNIIIMNKPSGLPSQSADGVSLESMMRRYLFDKNEYSNTSAYTPSLCHRIDRNTSGLVIGAKNIAAHRVIADKIKNKEIRKFYRCTASGIINPKHGEISGYIVKSENNKVRFSDSKDSGGKFSALKYSTIGYSNDSTIAEVELLSGRTHQIRASFAHIGHPLAGDVKYGAKRDGKSEYQHLKACRLLFEFTTDAVGLEYLKGKIFEI